MLAALPLVWLQLYLSQLKAHSGHPQSKNKTASAASTPSQTPRTSIHLSPSDMAAIDHKAPTTITTTSTATTTAKAYLGNMQAMVLSRV
ncbi:hypothetical protein BGX33_001116 [Mortierella sp. NVP41]|nr:hypothetical protein BGX33_001116 [Mortierella sp. NVP41]